MTDYASLATTIAAVPRPRSRRRLAGPPIRHDEEASAGGSVNDAAGTAPAPRHGRWSPSERDVEGEEAAVREVKRLFAAHGRRTPAPLSDVS